MKSVRTVAVLAGTIAALAGCMHQGGTQSASAGDVAIDSLTASRTAILRVQNSYPTEVRLYTVIKGQANYVAKAMPGETRTWVLDPQLFPAQEISFEARPGDGKPPQIVGPYKVNRGETIELVVPATLESARATIHRSTP